MPMSLNVLSTDLAVVGGGPAGLATVLAARLLQPDWRILWCRGSTRRFFPAYDGVSDTHRLNVPVERMGLDADAPIDFLEWLQRRHPSRAVVPGQFVPRSWLGEYLAERAASVTVEERDDEVRALCRHPDGWRLAMDDGEPLAAGAVVLALGLPAGPAVDPRPACWVNEVWAWWRTLSDEALPQAPGAEVLVVGSGLTAVDMVLGLRERGFSGRIRVVSSSGRWSLAHAVTPPLEPEARTALDDALAAANSALGMLRVLRAFARRHPWRAVIDALRSSTNTHWSALPLAEQRRVLRHLFGHWNRHRHRMAPDLAERLNADVALRLERGRIRIAADGRIERHHGGGVEVLAPALALDCRGPGFNAALAGDSLLARLVREGVLTAHPLGTGVVPPADPSLQVVGAARFGERFETLAVPELRVQAREAVQALVASQSRGTR